MRRVVFSWLGGLLAAGLALLAVAACSDLLAIDGPVTVTGADASPSAPVACGLPTGTPACAACVEAQCCALATACAASDACSAHESCVLPCGTDYACRAACLNASPPSAPGVADLDTCVVASCASACGVQCGSTGIEVQPDAATQCEECIVANACAATQACGASRECTEILDCQTGCTTPDCQHACAAGEDAGVALMNAVARAFGTSCLTECQYGEHWRCLASGSFPLTSARQIALTLTVTSALGGTGQAGVLVVACGPADPYCTTPIVSGTTDATGAVTLAVPVGSSGFSGHLELTGSGLTPELYFFDYSLTEPTSALGVAMFTPGAFATYVGLAGVTVDPTRGSIGVAAFDCAFETAPDVVVSATGADSGSQTLYLTNGTLSSAATATNETGVALLVNVPPGLSTLTAAPQGLHQLSSQTSVVVKAGYVTYVGLYPNAHD